MDTIIRCSEPAIRSYTTEPDDRVSLNNPGRFTSLWKTDAGHASSLLAQPGTRG